MKRIFILCLCLASAAGLQAQQSKKGVQLPVYNGIGAEIYFADKTVEVGDVNVGDTRVKTVEFTNIGKKPLILDDVISSCDCTTLEWTRNPVMPGQKGKIVVNYLAKTTGMISKRLTILSNANTDRVIMPIRGNVK